MADRQKIFDSGVSFGRDKPKKPEKKPEPVEGPRRKTQFNVYIWQDLRDNLDTLLAEIKIDSGYKINANVAVQVALETALKDRERYKSRVVAAHRKKAES